MHVACISGSIVCTEGHFPYLSLVSNCGDSLGLLKVRCCLLVVLSMQIVFQIQFLRLGQTSDMVQASMFAMMYTCNVSRTHITKTEGYSAESAQDTKGLQAASCCQGMGDRRAIHVSSCSHKHDLAKLAVDPVPLKSCKF